MKLPKGWNKMNNDEQRSWVAEQIKLADIKLQNLLKLSRLLQGGATVVSDGVEDRPDIAMLKNA